MTQKNWTKQELLLALTLYIKTPFGKLHNRNPEIIQLAKLIGRTPSSVAWKLVNFSSLDPELKKRGIKGATNCSKLDRQVWEEYYGNWELLATDEELTQMELKQEKPELKGEDKLRLVKQRVNQNFFRETLLANYHRQCCITGIPIPSMLIASHIIPWSIDKDNRLNPRNGLLLNALHDKAFDQGQLTISSEYKIILGSSLKKQTDEATKLYFHKYEGETIKLPERFAPDLQFLEYHNQHIFKQ